MNYENILAEVPDYQSFCTVDELNASSRRLVETFPERAEWSVIGQSRRGEDIPALRIGQGERAALLFAMPHPNEPIGSMMLEFLSWRLASDPDLVRALGYTWYMVKCVDPDSTRLNEGWFKGPFTLPHYARHYYRPPSNRQIEWTFPVNYKTLRFDAPLPETRALMNLIREVQPALLYSLHNSGFGGAYFYVSGACPPLHDAFAGLVAGQGLPLHRGEPELSFMTEHAPAIFQVPTAADIYEYYAGHSDRDPASLFQAGTSSFDYAGRIANAFGLVCELPYFYNAKIDNQTPTDRSRRDCILEALERDRGYCADLQKRYDRVQSYLTIPSPFRETVEHYLEHVPGALDADENWAKTDPDLARPATVAEAFDTLVIAKYWRAFHLSPFLRMVEAEAEASGWDGVLREAFQDAERAFNEHSQMVLQGLPYEVIPIQKLVRIQLGAGLLTARFVRENL